MCTPPGLSGDEFEFDGSGDGPARYNVIHYRRVAGAFQWTTVGNFTGKVLRLERGLVAWPWGAQVPRSVCSARCGPGVARRYHEGEGCCWTCAACGEFEVLSRLDDTVCETCAEGTIPDQDKEACMDLPEEYLSLHSMGTIFALSFALIGITLTLVVLGVFVTHHTTPVVRAAGRELSYVLLVGLLLCFSVTFLLVLRPSTLVCALQRFFTGFCFSIVYAALLTKTNRIQRIFNSGQKSSTKVQFISPQSQVVICGAIVTGQVSGHGASL